MEKECQRIINELKNKKIVFTNLFVPNLLSKVDVEFIRNFLRINFIVNNDVDEYVFKDLNFIGGKNVYVNYPLSPSLYTYINKSIDNINLKYYWHPYRLYIIKDNYNLKPDTLDIDTLKSFDVFGNTKMFTVASKYYLKEDNNNQDEQYKLRLNLILLQMMYCKIMYIDVSVYNILKDYIDYYVRNNLVIVKSYDIDNLVEKKNIYFNELGQML